MIALIFNKKSSKILKGALMWRTRGLRGSNLEELIAYTNDTYARQNLCRIDKIATPVKVVEIDAQGVITRGFFEKKSTVDFIGIIQGVFVAFDAKETALPRLPLNNIHPHQMDFMEDVIQQGGIAFLIIHFTQQDQYFLMSYELLRKHMDHSTKKSIAYRDMREAIEISYDAKTNTLCYLDALNQLLSQHEG